MTKKANQVYKHLSENTPEELGFMVGLEFQRRTGYTGERIDEFFGGFEQGFKEREGFFYGLAVERARQDYIMGLKDRLDGHDMSQGEHRRNQGAITFIGQWNKGWVAANKLSDDHKNLVRQLLFGDPQDIRERTKKAVMKDLTGVRA